jgi:hypothetical protein
MVEGAVGAVGAIGAQDNKISPIITGKNQNPFFSIASISFKTY